MLCILCAVPNVCNDSNSNEICWTALVGTGKDNRYRCRDRDQMSLFYVEKTLVSADGERLRLETFPMATQKTKVEKSHTKFRGTGSSMSAAGSATMLCHGDHRTVQSEPLRIYFVTEAFPGLIGVARSILAVNLFLYCSCVRCCNAVTLFLLYMNRVRMTRRDRQRPSRSGTRNL